MFLLKLNGNLIQPSRGGWKGQGRSLT